MAELQKLMPLRAHKQREAVQPLDLTPPVQRLHNCCMNQLLCERWQREECKIQHNCVSDRQYGIDIQLLFVPVKKGGCKQRAKQVFCFVFDQ